MPATGCEYRPAVQLRSGDKPRAVLALKQRRAHRRVDDADIE
jgi:hypothetical protein